MSAQDLTYGEEWLRACNKDVSPNGARVANLINWWLRGIYHAQNDVLRADWSGDYVNLTIRASGGRLSTVDADDLTRLVVAAHDHAIRVSIEPCNPRYLRILFHPRHRDHGHVYGRHPSIDGAISRMPRPFIYGDPESLLEATA